MIKSEKGICYKLYPFSFSVIFTASTASFTSCTRKMSVPFCRAKVFSMDVPLRLSSAVESIKL